MTPKGVPRGYQHNWRYKGHWKETKIAPGKWTFKYTALKHRKGSPRGGLNIGQSVIWNIHGTQTATKVSGRTYKTILKGTKTLKRSPK